MTRRERFRKGLSPLYLPVYDALCEELSERWQPYYGLRSFEEQAALYAQGRGKPGRIVTYAKPGESAHNYGCATDWTYWEGSTPIWPVSGDPLWEQYAQACEKVGARWGGTFRSVDCPHNELALTVSWKDILSVYRVDGEEKALERIKACLG